MRLCEPCQKQIHHPWKTPKNPDSECQLKDKLAPLKFYLKPEAGCRYRVTTKAV